MAVVAVDKEDVPSIRRTWDIFLYFTNECNLVTFFFLLEKLIVFVSEKKKYNLLTSHEDYNCSSFFFVILMCFKTQETFMCVKDVQDLCGDGKKCFTLNKLKELHR